MSTGSFIDRNLTTINWSIRIITALMFIYGAYSKIYPFNANTSPLFFFEKQLVDLKICDICIVPYFSRSIIAFELFLGLALLQPHYLKKYIIPVTILVLVAFCIHLGIVLNEYGNSGNCGCFGQKLPMTPLQALIKNVISIILLVFLYVKINDQKKSSKIVVGSLLAGSFLFIFLMMPWKSYCCECTAAAANEISSTPITAMSSASGDGVTTNTSAVTPENNTVAPVQKNTGAEKVNGKITKTDTVKTAPPVVVDNGPARVTSAFGKFHKFSDGKSVDLDDGIKVVCLFNLDCDHCMETCRQMCELSKKINVPAYLICWGEESQTENFFKTATCRYPYTIVGPEVFFPLLGKAPSPPRVVVLHNGNIIADWDSETFSATKLEGLLKK